jgi:hypothetical protein
MKALERKSFVSFVEFRNYAQMFRVLFFHVFSEKPDQRVLDEFSTYNAHEALLLFDVKDDRGFLEENVISIDLTRDRRPMSKLLIDMRGLGAWAKGKVVCATEEPEYFDDVVRKARSFTFPACVPATW